MTQNVGPEPEDLRVRRTRSLLQKAFIELTVEKGFAALTVQDIAERAMVNRSTFYRHYLDKYDLLEKYMNEVFALTATQISQADQEWRGPGSRPPVGLIALLTHIQSNAEFYRVMFGPKGDPVFTQFFRQKVEDRFRYLILNLGTVTENNNSPLELRVSYISYADIGAILWWLDHDQPCSPEQLATWLTQLTTANAGLRSPAS